MSLFLRDRVWTGLTNGLTQLTAKRAHSHPTSQTQVCASNKPMGHRSEKKSHKHKHHRRHKSLKKETSKQQHLEVRESEPESGEILGELVGLDATLSRQNALLLQLRPDSCAFKENEGEAQPAPEANQHPSTLPNNEGATPLKASNRCEILSSTLNRSKRPNRALPLRVNDLDAACLTD